MKENQKDIYFITGESKDVVGSSSFVETLKKRGLECLYMTSQSMSTWCSSSRSSTERTLSASPRRVLSFQRTRRRRRRRRRTRPSFEPLCKVMKDILDKKVEKVVVSNRLVS